jgi:hypothetical protein
MRDDTKSKSLGTMQSPILWDDAESNPVGRRKVQSDQSWVRKVQLIIKKQEVGAHLKAGHWVLGGTQRRSVQLLLFGWFQIFVKFDPFSSP